jgi:hypothetical protein
VTLQVFTGIFLLATLAFCSYDIYRIGEYTLTRYVAWLDSDLNDQEVNALNVDDEIVTNRS